MERVPDCSPLFVCIQSPDLRRSNTPLAVSLTEKPLKSQSFECRPRHASVDVLDEVDLLPTCCRSGRTAFADASIVVGCEA